MTSQSNPVFLILGIVMIVFGMLGVAYSARHGITTTVTRRYVHPAAQSVHPTESGVGWRGVLVIGSSAWVKVLFKETAAHRESRF